MSLQEIIGKLQNQIDIAWEADAPYWAKDSVRANQTNLEQYCETLGKKEEQGTV
jgi:hypothetical protein